MGNERQPRKDVRHLSSLLGTYGDHVAHFLHDNVTVEFHYWRSDRGVVKQRTLGVINGKNQPLTRPAYEDDL